MAGVAGEYGHQRPYNGNSDHHITSDAIAATVRARFDITPIRRRFSPLMPLFRFSPEGTGIRVFFHATDASYALLRCRHT